MKTAKEKKQLLTTDELADRWTMDPGTIENWRGAKKGPRFLKLGKGASAFVRYRLVDIELYEEKMMRGRK